MTLRDEARAALGKVEDPAATIELLLGEVQRLRERARSLEAELAFYEPARYGRAPIPKRPRRARP